MQPLPSIPEMNPERFLPRLLLPAILFAATAGSAFADALASPTSSNVVKVTRTTTTPETSARLINLSTRLFVGTGDNVGIAGFAIRGGSKRLIVRAIGPDLANRGVTGVLLDPRVQLVDAAGGQRGENDNWAQTQQAEITASGFAPANNAESAIITTLEAGNYTAIVSGAGGTSGVALVEVYDLDPAGTSVLINLSTRGSVQTGDNVMIVGFVIGGRDSKRVAVRAIGPDLASRGVAGALADPTVTFYGAAGSLAQNDDWRRDQDLQLIASGLAPNYNGESALITILAPGAYTAVVRGIGETSGIALAEIYDLP